MPSLRSMATAFALPFALAMLLLTIPGCGKKNSGASSPGNADGSEDASRNGSDGVDGGDAGEPEIVSDLTSDSFNQMKQMWETQVAGIEAQTQTIVQAAAEQSDAQLTDLVNKLKTKTADMRSKFDALKYPTGVRAIQDDLPKWMGEAGELIASASERLQTVLRERAAVPPVTPG